jgi:hypothetical protein
MPRGARNDGLPVDGRRRAKRHDQATIRAAGECDNAVFYVVDVGNPS